MITESVARGGNRWVRWGALLTLIGLAHAEEPAVGVQTPDGRITFSSPAPTATGNWNFKPTRWGRYDVQAVVASASAGASVNVELGNQRWSQKLPATAAGSQPAIVTLGRIYLPTSDPFTVRISPDPSNSSPFALSALVMAPAPEGEVGPAAADGSLTLPASAATTHSVVMRYEPATNKNCLGYWVNPADWADWTFTVPRAGAFDVELWQGCGSGQGGSDVVVEVDGQKLPFTVEETGHFQNFIPRRLGRVQLTGSGPHRLAIHPQRKQVAAVMDVRQVRLLPASTQTIPGAGARTFVPSPRVVVLGDSITYAGGWAEFVEAWLHLHFPEADIQFLNLGLPSETVSGLSEPGHAGGSFPRPDLHERLTRVLEQLKPTLILACYGMNDGIYFPLEDGRFKKYQDGIRRLREQAAHVGVPVIHLTPPVFDPLPLAGHTLPAGRTEYPSPFEGYNGVLDAYSAWLVSQRAQGWRVIDIHTPMNAYLAEKRQTDPKFVLAGDGVHLNAEGHWLIAREVLRELGAPEPITRANSPDALIAAYPRGAEVLALVKQRQAVLKDPLLTSVGHKRPGMGAGLPLPEAQQQAKSLTAKLNP